LLAEPLPDDVRELLVVIQHELFNLGGELSIPGFELLKSEAVLRLDEALAHYNAQLPRLAEFIFARRHPQRRPGPCGPHGGSSGRASFGHFGHARAGERCAKAVPQPAE
jgi:Cobalamin adenosyltransferase